jgi:pyruvate dehydrogenase E2 component (dihydrolipoamide acetyltransferase)
MAKPVIMPKLGFTQDSSEIVRWLKNAGDAVEKGDPIAEVTTDKVNMEVEAPATGILDGIRFEVGAVVPVTEVIAYIRAANEPPLEGRAAAIVPAQAAQMPAQESVPAVETPAVPPETQASRVTPVAAKLAEAKGIDVNLVRGTGPGGRITKQDVEAFEPESAPGDRKVRAVPAARKIAGDLGIDLRDVQGSGPRGRVQSADVRAEQARRAQTSTTPAARPAIETAQADILKTIPLTGMRFTIATRMQKSSQEAPHITFDADIDATAAEALRSRANALLSEGQPRISLTAIIVKACAWALKRHPLVNSRLDGQQVLLLKPVNIGIAVALEEGLIVPVVSDADQKGLTAIAADIAEAADRARKGRLRIEDLSGGTFTVSNLGMFGVDRFTAIINPPETAIVAIGRVTKRLVPDEQGQAVVRPMMTATLSADHRVVDGAEAARFLSDVRQTIEHPELLVM